jgi:DNA-binding NarL/FixJ family response regulator
MARVPRGRRGKQRGRRGRRCGTRLAPDAVLLDVWLGDGNGFDVACTLTPASPGLAVLLVSAEDYRHCHALVRDCGARGFVLKSELACADLAEYFRSHRA